MQAYSNPKRASDPHALPDLEIFEVGERGYVDGVESVGPLAGLVWKYEGKQPGYYWWPCFPGCLPDSEPTGPFGTQEEALQNAQEGSQEAEGEPQPKSWAPEFIADSSGVWAGNGLRFAKREDAEAWARGLADRWILVREHRAVPSEEEPNR